MQAVEKRKRGKAKKHSVLRGKRPHWQDVQQLFLENCYLLVVLKGLALRNPDIIKNIIWENPDGETVTVRLFEPVFSPDESSIVGHHPTEYVFKKKWHLGLQNWHHAKWVYYIEDAYAEHRQKLYPEKYAGKSRAAALSSGHSHECYWHLLGVDAYSSTVAYEELMKARLHADNAPFFLSNDLFESHKAIGKHPKKKLRKILQSRLVLAAFKDPAIHKKFLVVFNNNVELLEDFKKHFSYKNYQRFDDFLLQKRTDKDLEKLSVILPKVKKETLTQLMEYLNEIAKPLHKEIDKVYDDLNEMLAKGEYVSAGTLHKKKLPNKKIVPGHAYHVLNVFKSKDGGKYVVLENPWGRSVPKSPEISGPLDAAIRTSAKEQNEVSAAKGVFILSLDEFVENFRGIYFTDIKNTIIREQDEFKEFEAQLNDDKAKLSKLQEDGNSPILQEDAMSLFSVDSGLGDEVNSDADAVSHDSVDSGNEDDIRSRDEVLRCNQENLQQKECRLQWLHNLAMNSTATRDFSTQKTVDILPQVQEKLESYLSGFDQNTFSQKNQLSKWSHRLFSRADNRYISQARRDRANIILALINAYNNVTEDADKNAILKLILDIRDQHKKDVSGISKFHGNRLGKLLDSFDNLQVEDCSSTLSLKGEQVLCEMLQEQGFCSSDSKAIMQQANGIVMVDAIKHSLAYEHYKDTSEKQPRGTSEKQPRGTSFFAAPKSYHQVDLLPQRGEEPVSPGFGSSFS